MDYQNQTLTSPQDSPVNQPQATVNILSEPTFQESTPVAVNIISIALFILASLYLLFALVIFAIVVLLNYSTSFGWGYFVFDLLRYFPSTGIVPILLALAAFVYFLVAIKIRNQTRASWIMALTCLVIIPLPLSIAIGFLINLHSQLGSTGNNVGQNAINFKLFQDITSASTLTDLLMWILILISIILLLIKHREFEHQGKPLSNKAKIFLSIIFLVAVLPVIGTMSYGYYTTTDKDRGFTAAQKNVSFHILRPSYLPLDFVQWARPTPAKDVSGGMNAIGLIYGPPLNNAREPGAIVIIQEQVTTPFDLQKLVNSQIKDRQKEKITTISLSQSRDGRAYLRQVTDDSFYLYYIDSNSVLYRIHFSVFSLDEAKNVISSFQ